MLGSALRAWEPAAACQVDPAVSSARSISATSGPPELRQMIQHAGADNAAANNDRSVVRFHALMLLGLGKGKRANCSVKIMTLLADGVPAAFSVTALTRNQRPCESGSAKADDNRTPPS
jgi:hypothetical protein